MDLSEPENRREISYGHVSRFEGSGQGGPEVIRQFDGHRIPTRTPRAEPDLDHEFTANEYCCECGDEY